MVLPMGGGGMGAPRGPPTEYCLSTLPKVRILIIGIAVLSFVRMVTQSQVEGVIIDGLFDLLTPIAGYCLFKDLQTMNSCLCTFMVFAWLSAVNDMISLIMRLSEYRENAFCADGNKRVVGNRLITCNADQPAYTSTLICITILQGYAGILGYRMLKSATMQQAQDFGAGGLLGNDVMAQQAGPREMRPAANPASLAPRAPAQPPQFTAFAGTGHQLGS
ncbi:unnamed protein product [Amoebophrya sp. A25]|nr:unnamed protein product [Amoebophrya sp. A25]|eukprot:GSA25T00000750001.1